MSDDEIDNAVRFSTREDKVQFLKDTKTAFDTKNEYDEKEREKEVKRIEVEEKAYEKLMSGGQSQDVAYANAKLFGQFFKKYGSGNIKEFDKWFDKFEVQYNIPAENINSSMFQSVHDAGAEANEIEAAQKEWNEKGTDSKYFKNFSGNAPIVNANEAGSYNFKDNKKVVVQGYHGSSVADIEEFDSEKTNYGHISQGFNFFTNNKDREGESAEFYAGQNGKIYECYILMNKPLVYDATGWKDDGIEYKTPVEFFDLNKGEITRTFRKGDYDGIIVRVGDNCIYAVKNSNQIKSVDNRGTFDGNNPNIYFQGGFSKFFDNVARKVNVMKTIINGFIGHYCMNCYTRNNIKCWIMQRKM